MRPNFWTLLAGLAIGLCILMAWEQKKHHEFIRIAYYDSNSVDANAFRVCLDTRTYEDGVNDALKCFTLLNLEIDLKGERKTFAEMNAIVCERLKVKPREDLVPKK